jgi:23S rRNA G2069 N7-methylase RlmK/C1962 C5-methylase RlmI
MRHRFLYAALVGFTVFLVLFELSLIVNFYGVEEEIEDASPPQESWTTYTHDYFYLQHPSSWTIQENTDPNMLVTFNGEERKDQFMEVVEVSLYEEEKETTALETLQQIVEETKAEATEEEKYESLDQREFDYGDSRAASLLSRVEATGVSEKIITYCLVVPKGKKTFIFLYMVEEKNYDRARLRKVLDSLVVRF